MICETDLFFQLYCVSLDSLFIGRYGFLKAVSVVSCGYNGSETWVKPALELNYRKKFCIFSCTCIVSYHTSFWTRCSERDHRDLVYSHRFSSPKCQGQFFNLRNTSSFLFFTHLLIKFTFFVSLCSVQYFSKLSNKSF